MAGENTIANPLGDFSKEAQRSTPGAALNAPTYTKFHLAISLGEYDQVHGSGNQRRADGAKGNLRMTEVIEATSADFLYHLQRVGQKYGWDRRQEYQPENHAMIDAMMAHEKTKLFEFFVRGELAGFCLATTIDPRSKKAEIIDRFKQQRRLPANFDAIEINKFGLYDEFTGKGHGNFFLSKTLKVLLGKEKHGIVYLDTRDTNHRGVLNFYARHGIDVFFQQELPNDQVDTAPPVYTRPDAAQRTTVEINGDHGKAEIANTNTKDNFTALTNTK